MSTENPKAIERSFFVMGGNFKIIAIGVPSEIVDQQITFLQALEKLWSRFKSDSEITKLNNAEGKPTEVSDLTVELVSAMINANRITSGYFDPTTLPLLVNSGYAKSRQNSNDQTVLPKSAKWPGEMQAIQIQGNTITMPIGTTVDPGGIAKGLSADLVVADLMFQGATGALVNANGDVVVAGEAPQGGPWLIGIEDPYDSSVEVDQVKVVKGAIATSSRVHQIWEKEKAEVHHIVNPLTGSTAVTDCLTATVICGVGSDAEALAKIPFILDIQNAIEFVENAGAECFIIDQHRKTHQTSGWNKFK